MRYYFPFLTDLLNNPSSTIQTWLERYYPWIRWFFNDPSIFIIDRLSRYSWELASFLQDPIHWMRSWFAGLLGINEIELNDLPRALFRVVMTLILNSWGTFQEEVSDTICNIVLKFI